jgi:hypothetical protein
LNFALLIVSSLFLTLAGDFVYKMHGKWFPMPRERFNAALYSMIGMYKIMVFVFNVAPWIALAIIG